MSKKQGGQNVVDMTGKTYHSLKVLERNGSIGKLAAWNCLCPCGVIFKAKGSDIRAGKTKTCGCRTSIVNKRNWQGYKLIPKKYWSSIVNNAEQRFISFNISIKDAYNLFISQKQKCNLSNVEISFHENTASLDRIDSNKGYFLENVQWVHKSINKLKGKMPDSDFINWCKKVSECH